MKTEESSSSVIQKIRLLVNFETAAGERYDCRLRVSKEEQGLNDNVVMAVLSSVPSANQTYYYEGRHESGHVDGHVAIRNVTDFLGTRQ